jgi:3-hydroxybutyryl-CoA dehydrogenase
MGSGLVGVVGAGVMGTGVAECLAETGHRVALIDVSATKLESARRSIRSSLRMSMLLKRRIGTTTVDTVIERISFVCAYDLLHEAQFVIENVVEKWDVKEGVYRQLDSICPAECIFAANTSGISITRIAAITRRPEKVIGMHFMNPAPMKPMVEVIRGYHTSDSTLATSQQLLAEMRKEWIVVNDMPGFASNRVLMLMINEAIWLVQDQVTSFEQVDLLFKRCFGHPMGPLETGDLIGLDTILDSLEVLYESYRDAKYRPCPLLTKMVHAGRWGRKSGQGFYDYEAGTGKLAS